MWKYAYLLKIDFANIFNKHNTKTLIKNKQLQLIINFRLILLPYILELLIDLKRKTINCLREKTNYLKIKASCLVFFQQKEDKELFDVLKSCVLRL